MTASTARPQITEKIKIRISATRIVEHEYTRNMDATQLDKLHYNGQITDRQYAIGIRLYALYRHAGLEPRVTPRYDTLRDHVDDDGEFEVGMEPDEARSVYNELLRRAGILYAERLADLMIPDRHPGVWRLATAQEALDWLGDEWGMDK